MNGQTCVIIGGGQILDYPAVADRIVGRDFIICADSGYDHCAALGVVPDLIVGDFDSIQTPAPEQIPTVPYPRDKNYTDTSLAIDIALERGYGSIILTGVLGGRLDHTMANFQSIAALSGRGIEACLTDGLTDIYAVTSSVRILQPREGYYFSVLSLSEVCENVNIIGARYQLQNHTLTFDDPRAISNEFVGIPVRLSVRKGTLAVMLVPRD